MTLKYAAAYMGVEFSTLARYERAEWPFRRDHIIALLDMYGIADEAEREELLALSKSAWRMHQWSYPDGSTDEPHTCAADHSWVERQAEEVRVYSGMLIPDLLHSRDYTAAIIESYTPRANVRAFDQHLNAHITRQERLHDKPPVRVNALIEEAALMRPVGSRLVLRAQLEHLAHLVDKLPHVEIRVLSTGLGMHPGVHGAFTVYQMPRPYPEVAYHEHLGGQQLMEAGLAERHVQAHRQMWEQTALGPHESIELIDKLAEQASRPLTSDNRHAGAFPDSDSIVDMGQS